MDEILIQYYHNKLGELILGSYRDQLCLCDWRFRRKRESIDKRIQAGLQADYREGDSEILARTVEQLEKYFIGELKNFTIPLLLVGSDFQKSVWQELRMIPYGQTITYLELSRRLGNENAIRAVASANGANAISILVPCHRIIGSDGELVGYAGGIRVKRKLLRLEGALRDTQLEIFDL